MCELTGNKTKKRVGYKVLAYKDGKFYSTFTGQLFKTGKVKKAPKYCKRLDTYWNGYLDREPLKCQGFYRPFFDGKTSAFTKKSDLNFLYNRIAGSCLKRGYKLIKTKITFEGDRFEGYYEIKARPIIAGDTIKSIEIIK